LIAAAVQERLQNLTNRQAGKVRLTPLIEPRPRRTDVNKRRVFLHDYPVVAKDLSPRRHVRAESMVSGKKTLEFPTGLWSKKFLAPVPKLSMLKIPSL
jgi:hypothetical protein